MNFEELINKRESVRMFSDRKVDKELIMKIINAGRLAPTAKNNQPEIIYVIESEDAIKKLDEASPCRYNAPVVLLVCADKNIAWNKENYSSCEMDVSIVSSFMILEATNLGVDNIWVKMFDENKIKELFNLEENIVPICLIPLGYRKEEYKGSPNHLNRKNIDDIVKFI